MAGLFVSSSVNDLNLESSAIPNHFEKAIFNEIASTYPSLRAHLPFIFVKSRECTGVGGYINIGYTGKAVSPFEPGNCAISTNAIIKLPGLKIGLGYEIAITNGLINFIELITYGEDWNGDTAGFEICPA